MTLLTKTLRLVRKTKRPTIEVCKAAKVKVRWYNRFKAGDYPDPGVNKVERVYNVLRKS